MPDSFAGGRSGNSRDMDLQPVPPSPPPLAPRCNRCARPATVVVDSDVVQAPLAACIEHLEWAFLPDVDEWSGRRRSA